MLVSVIKGAGVGGMAHATAIADFTVMTERTSHLTLLGPSAVEAVTGETVSREELGGARTHSQLAGTAHCLAADDDEALDYVRTLLSYLPANNMEEHPRSSRKSPW